jgi:hypothetical protein
MQVDGSSNRAFGWVFVAVFGIVAFTPLLHGAAPRWWALICAFATAAVTVLRPGLLTVPNRLWTRLGLLLGRVVSPVVIGILFFGVFTPFGPLMRALGHDPLRLKTDPAASSYWIDRAPPGPAPESMKDQF